MNNYLIKIEYDGTNYAGWQNQKNGISIQQVIESVLKKVLKTKVKIIGAGRTDKGVHAYGQYANFKIKKIIEDEKIYKLIIFFYRKNDFTNLNKKKSVDFHSRYSAKERIYEYCIINREGSLSIYKNKAWHIKKT